MTHYDDQITTILVVEIWSQDKKRNVKLFNWHWPSLTFFCVHLLTQVKEVDILSKLWGSSPPTPQTIKDFIIICINDSRCWPSTVFSMVSVSADWHPTAEAATYSRRSYKTRTMYDVLSAALGLLLIVLLILTSPLSQHATFVTDGDLPAWVEFHLKSDLHSMHSPSSGDGLTFDILQLQQLSNSNANWSRRGTRCNRAFNKSYI